tara:strand:- start:624 stop:755 length:132 start_codon:yes stop_codon:yes gene_type:complete
VQATQGFGYWMGIIPLVGIVPILGMLHNKGAVFTALFYFLSNG